MIKKDKKHKLLVVDDSSTNTFLIESFFKEEGYEVFSAFTGKKAIELAEKHHPDIILLDIMMPGMNGYDVMNSLKKNKKISQIPIIVVTAKDQKDEYEKVTRLGASDFIQKPIDLNILLEKVGKYVAGK